MDSQSLWERQALVLSMLGPMFNKIKMCLEFPKKSIELAENPNMKNFIFLLGEQLLPQWCRKNMKDAQAINDMHNLMYLFTYKIHQVFQARVIHQIIDQNWDLKGFKAVLIRILEKINIKDTPQTQNMEKYLDKLINSQNMQSSSCIKAIGSFLRKKSKEIDADDLTNPIKTYQTTFEFLRDDIQRYRDQNIPHSCFQVLHPWAYDLDSVDMKYIVNTNLEGQITKILSANVDAQLFWLAFFKPQLTCSADEFFEAIRQLAEINGLPQYYAQNYKAFDQLMEECQYVISVEDHSEQICRVVKNLIDATIEQGGKNALRFQYKTYKGPFSGSEWADEKTLAQTFVIDQVPNLNQFKGDPELEKLVLNEIDRPASCNLSRKVVHTRTVSIPEDRVVLKFESVDTEELKDLEIPVEGDRAVYKIGEGETSHFHIPNDKKLWETQFMICSIDGKFYIRDFGFVHTTRLKLDTRCEVQLQKGSVVDLGKVVHYHFDKVLHYQKPTAPESDNYYIMRQGKKYDVDPDDYPQLRARPTWVSAEEAVDNIQNEINVISDSGKGKAVNSIGRSMKRDVQIKLKAVSADHCAVAYTPDKGWVLTEKGKDKPSSNGTYIFLKSLQQMRDHMPSDLVPLHDGMILSFVNYELRVKIEKKTGDDVKKQTDAQTEFFAQRDYEMNLESSMKAAAAPVPETVAAPEVNVDDAQPVKEEAPQPVVEDPVPVAEEPVQESAPAEEEKKEEPVPEEPVAEEPVAAAEEPKAEEPIAEEPKADDPKEEEKPAEAIPVEEPVAAEEKKEEPVAAEAEQPVEEKKDEEPAQEEKKEEPVAEEPAAAEEAKPEEPKEEEKPAEDVKEDAKEPEAAAQEENKDQPTEAAKEEEKPAEAEAAKEEAPVVEEKKDEPPAEDKKEDAPAKEEEKKDDAQPPVAEAAAEEKKEEPAAAEAPVEAAKEEEKPAEEKKEEVAAPVEEKKDEEAKPAEEDKKEEAKPEEPPKEEEKPVEAEAPKEEPKADEPPKEQEKPAEPEVAKAEEPKAEEPKPEDAKPAEDEKKEEAKPAEDEKKEEEKPAEDAKKEEDKPAEAEAPKEEAKPAEAEAAKEEPKPAEDEKKDEAKPDEAPKEEAKPEEPEAKKEDEKPAEPEVKKEDEKPADDPKPAAAEEPKKEEEAKPAEDAKKEASAEKPKEAEAPKEDAKPAEEPPKEEAKPADDAKKEDAKPAEEEKKEDAKPDEAKPTEDAKPAEDAKSPEKPAAGTEEEKKD